MFLMNYKPSQINARNVVELHRECLLPHLEFGEWPKNIPKMCFYIGLNNML